MTSESTTLQQGLDHTELVADLGPAEHRNERSLRVVAEAEQHLDLALHQQTHRRRQACAAGRRSRRGRDGRRRTHRRRRGRCPAISWATNCGSLPSSPGSKRRFSSNSTPGASSARRALTASIEYFGFGLPFGRPRCDAHTTRGVTAGQPFDRRQRRADAEVVGDDTVVHRHVEIGADQHPLAAHVAEIGERGDTAHRFFFGSLPPAYRVVSISRFE